MQNKKLHILRDGESRAAANEVRSRSQRLFSSLLLLLPYISTNHIHNDSVTTQIKVLECFECGLDATLTRCSGTSILDSNPVSRSAAVVALKKHHRTLKPRLSPGLSSEASFFFGKRVRNTDSDQIRSNLLMSVACFPEFLETPAVFLRYPQRGIMFHYHGLSSTIIRINNITT